MTQRGATMVSSGDDQKNGVPPWLRPIASIKFYDLCKTHSSKKCDFYCKVCMVALCIECKKQHDLSEHEIIKAYKAAEEASFRKVDLAPLWDTSDIDLYKRNVWLVAFIHKRGDGITHSSGPDDIGVCKTCQYRLKSLGAKYCSMECKVEAVMKMNGSGSMKNEAKREVETTSEGSASNVQSFRKRPRKQKNPQRAPLH